MPWCEACAKYMAPSAMNVDGTCPHCGRAVPVASIHGTVIDDDVSVPWHFKLLVGALVVYLTWRVIQLFS